MLAFKMLTCLLTNLKKGFFLLQKVPPSLEEDITGLFGSIKDVMSLDDINKYSSCGHKAEERYVHIHMEENDQTFPREKSLPRYVG